MFIDQLSSPLNVPHTAETGRDGLSEPDKMQSRSGIHPGTVWADESISTPGVWLTDRGSRIYFISAPLESTREKRRII